MLCRFKAVRKQDHTHLGHFPTQDGLGTVSDIPNITAAASKTMQESFASNFKDLRASLATHLDEEASSSDLRPRGRAPLPIKATPPPSPVKGFNSESSEKEQIFELQRESVPDSQAQIIAAQKEEIAQLQSQINELKVIVTQLVAVIKDSNSADTLLNNVILKPDITETSSDCSRGINSAVNDQVDRVAYNPGPTKELSSENSQDSRNVFEDMLRPDLHNIVNSSLSSLENLKGDCNQNEDSSRSVSSRKDNKNEDEFDETKISDVLRRFPRRGSEEAFTPKASLDGANNDDLDSNFELMEPPSAIILNTYRDKPVLQNAKLLSQRLPLRRLSLEKKKKGEMYCIYRIWLSFGAGLDINMVGPRGSSKSLDEKDDIDSSFTESEVTSENLQSIRFNTDMQSILAIERRYMAQQRKPR